MSEKYIPASTEARPILGLPSHPKSRVQTPRHKFSLNFTPGTLPSAGAPGWVAMSLHVFWVAATCPEREMALSHGERGNVQGCLSLANSHEYSAQIDPN